MNPHVVARGFTALIAIWLAGGWNLEAQQRPEVTKALVDQWMQELSNWGRWGQDDELGAVNLITADKRVAAAGLGDLRPPTTPAAHLPCRLLDDVPGVQATTDRIHHRPPFRV